MKKKMMMKNLAQAKVAKRTIKSKPPQNMKKKDIATECNKEEEDDEESGTSKGFKKNNQKQTKAQKERTKSSAN